MMRTTKRLNVGLLALGLSVSAVFAQAPEKMSYQAVVRDASSALVASQGVGVQISILQNSATGTAVYVETQSPTTNANGLVSLEIGTGIVVSGTFATINWAGGTYYIKTETDPTAAGGTNYTITGTSQLLSTPYALHSKSAKKLVNNTGTAGVTVQTSGETQIASLPVYSQTTDTLLVVADATGNLHTISLGSLASLLVNSYGLQQTPPLIYPVGTVHCSTPTAVVDATSTTGEIWMDRNLGASQVATSSTDALAYGDLYQWGRAADGHQCRTSGTTTTTTISTTDTPGHAKFITTSSSPNDWRSSQNNSLWQGVNGTNNPCPIGYRLPTHIELTAEKSSWGGANVTGAFTSPLKLTAGGFRQYNTATLLLVGDGIYWTSTVAPTEAYRLYFNGSFASNTTHYRSKGFSVRCIKN